MVTQLFRMYFIFSDLHGRPSDLNVMGPFPHPATLIYRICFETLAIYAKVT